MTTRLVLTLLHPFILIPCTSTRSLMHTHTYSSAKAHSYTHMLTCNVHTHFLANNTGKPRDLGTWISPKNYDLTVSEGNTAKTMYAVPSIAPTCLPMG